MLPLAAAPQDSRLRRMKHDARASPSSIYTARSVQASVAYFSVASW